jgi:divalent metal cation (Fe/Co/Zn/Cd) transporter
MRLEEAHRISEKLEKKIKEVMDIEATIHVEPIRVTGSKKQPK